MYLRIALLSPPYADLTYLPAPEFPESFWRPGLRIAIPLGNGKLRVGVLLETMEQSGLPASVNVKPVHWPLETTPVLPAELLEVARQLAARQASTPGDILGHLLPKGLRTTVVHVRRLHGNGPMSLALRDIGAPGGPDRRTVAEELVGGVSWMPPAAQDAAMEEICSLLVDPPWPVRPAASRQIALLDYCHDRGAVSRRQLLKDMGTGASTVLAALVKAGCIGVTRGEREPEEDAQLLPPPPAPFKLNADQAKALKDLLGGFSEKGPAFRLLFGVTGSGKTAVYLELAKTALKRGRSVMLLAPEVALALKLHRDASCAVPGCKLYLYHGYQTSGRREHTFRELAARKEPCIVVGTRSALFLPVHDPGCIVLDEEHDASFKQDEGLPYHGREVAWFRTQQSGGLLVLGSATPDLKTFHAAMGGNPRMLRLPERVSGRPLPPVELVDIRGNTRFSEGSLLVQESLDALRETIDRGEQAVVLLNRRGYAPLMYCLDCGATVRCPECEIGLAYHKGRNHLLCHYCGYSIPFPSPCPSCRGMNYLPLGEGTERLAEQLTVLAGREVLRLDRDSARRPGRMEEILLDFARQRSPILVGTQMLSKGHHFPQVTLVVVADGDLGLNLPDYRAAERTFQLLVQSAGRAGRGERQGRVLIQTRDVEHYCWRFVRSGDYEGFYAEEIERRKARRYPPFVRLGLLRMSFEKDDEKGRDAVKEISAVLKACGKDAGVQVLGPAPAPLAMLRGRLRFQCLMKGSEWSGMRSLYLQVKALPAASRIRISLDLDPVNML
ncbi:MAG: primosomal protein N' [Desulfovibrio sp.]|nr:primosomal protein N' [Desulfovibrio sp.]